MPPEWPANPSSNPTPSAKACRRLLEEAGVGPVIFAGVDAYYAIGPEAWLPSYRVACLHDSGALRMLAAKGIDVFCLEHQVGDAPMHGRDTHALIAHPATQAWIDEIAQREGAPQLLIFKPSAQVEAIAEERGWHILGSPARLARPLENKVRFYQLLDELQLPHPPWKEIDPSQASYAALVAELGQELVVQGAHGFSGKSSYLVKSEADFAAAAKELGARSARVAGIIPGYPATLNACVMGEGVVRIGRLFHQVTGAPECTHFPLGACGNDWSAQPIPEAAQWLAATVARTLGRHLHGLGYRGIFGLDFVITPINSVLTIEINPRLVSSIQLITRLEEARSRVPMLAYHLLATSKGTATRVPKVVQGNIEHDYPRLSGAQLVLHSLHATPVRVRGDLPTGIYRLIEARLHFERPSYHVEDCQGDDELLLLPAMVGRTLLPHGECARIQVRHAVLGLDPHPCFHPGRLTPRARMLAAAVYDALELEPETSLGSRTEPEIS